MRSALAIFLLLHGLAHTVGFAIPWRLIHSPDTPYRTTIAGGALDLGDAGIRAYGLLWALMALAFVIVAAQVLMRAPSWPASTIIVATVSSVLCLLSLPEARIGLIANAAVIATAILAMRNVWLTPAG